MSNLFQGLVSSAVTVYGVYRLGKTAYTINSNPNNANNNKEDIVDYEYYNEETISDKIIFIPKQYTERAIYENNLLEKFESNKQLFYYLRRRSNMEAIHSNLRIFKLKNKKHVEILIFCTDLHYKKYNCNNSNKNVLYIIGILNDKTPSNYNKKQIIEKWKMNEYFLNCDQIKDKYGIQLCDLPNGSFVKLKQEIFNIDMEKLIFIKNNISSQQYSQLKCIKTKPYNYNAYNYKCISQRCGGSTYLISSQKFYSAIKKANILRPIISFSEDKSIYYIDMILLVNIGENNYIGIIFRDYTKNNNYVPIDIAIDCYDIRNKMILFQAPNTINKYNEINKYKNNISKINIIQNIHYNNDYILEDKNNNNNQSQNEYLKDLELRLFEANNKLKLFENKVKKQKQIIKKQSRDIILLKEQNNHYFQQCLNPNSNIKPHSIHLQASRAAPITIFLDNNNYCQ